MKPIIFTVLLLVVSPPLFASNYSFLKDSSPVANFTEEDTTLFWNTLNKALDTLKDGEKVAWENTKSGNSGLVNPLKTYKQGSLLCRDVRIVNRAKENISESKYQFCKENDKWVLKQSLDQ